MLYIYSIINKIFSNTPFPHFMNAQNHEKFKFEYKITLMYLVFGVLWILFSDKVLEWFISDHHIRGHYQTYKGTFYVAVTAIFLFTFLKKHMQKIRKAESNIKQLNEDLEQKVAHRTLELNETNNKLKEINATKDKFFSIIAHDLRNPFNVILGYSQLLALNVSNMNTELIQKNVNNIQKSAQCAFDLLQNLLEWARSQTGKIAFHPEETSVQQLILTAFEATKLAAQNKQIDIDVNFEADKLVFADKNLINTVLRNLISNAIKFTPKNGQITIRTSSDSENVMISVIDNGRGILKEHIDLLFNINEKISHPGTENEPGTGLGLILCKEFIEKHGGEIKIESEPGKGSVFSFTLACSEKI